MQSEFTSFTCVPNSIDMSNRHEHGNRVVMCVHRGREGWQEGEREGGEEEPSARSGWPKASAVARELEEPPIIGLVPVGGT